jgi:CAAX prenyl protease-like protein
MTLRKHPAVPYTVPFLVFVLFLAASHVLPLVWWEYPLRAGLLAAVLVVFSRKTIDLRVPNLTGSLLLGAAIFLVWIAPDLLWPGYRTHWLFENAVTGNATSSIPANFRSEWTVLLSRTIRAAILVPIIEELFWRGWLLRWLIHPDFTTVPLGAYTAKSFWISAVLFASEHGPYWEVGLIAGVAFNWWIIRTKSLGNCILVHVVANAALSAYVIASGRWEYWL